MFEKHGDLSARNGHGFWILLIPATCSTSWQKTWSLAQKHIQKLRVLQMFWLLCLHLPPTSRIAIMASITSSRRWKRRLINMGLKPLERLDFQHSPSMPKVFIAAGRLSCDASPQMFSYSRAGVHKLSAISWKMRITPANSLLVYNTI